jgi:hypothetical protein
VADLETEITEPTESAPPPRDYCWIPTTKLVPGMVIARPLFGGHGRLVTIHLAVGSPITSSTIGQLINKGIECVAVEQDAAPDPSAYAQLAEQYAARLHEIFGPEPDENCRPLLEALLVSGPCRC